MTKVGQCRWCGRSLPAATKLGRPRQFCRASCRQRDYEARLRSREVGLSESELIVTRERLHQVFDQAYVLEAAVEDVERDLAVDDSEPELRRAVDWLVANARPLLQLVLKLQ